jgi:acyl-CoA thioesterase I
MPGPPLILRLAMWHFPSGESFMAGMLLFLLAHAGSMFFRKSSHRRSAMLVARLGLIWAFAVLTPTPLWLLVPLLISLLLLWFENRRISSQQTQMPSSDVRVTRLRWMVLCLGCATWLFELPYRFDPRLRSESSRLLIVADSITAGLNDGEETWPMRLARGTDWQIKDASQPGATLKSALQQVKLFDDQPAVLLLEIGGNDLLEGLPVPQFESDLDQLLHSVVRPGRSVVMFELPLPPLAYRYGVAQRRLASKHGVSLLPKRHLMSVLTTPGATVDGIHLSPLGHQRMSELVEQLIGDTPAAQSSSGHYAHVGPP